MEDPARLGIRGAARTMSIPLFLATPILVLWAPRSIPTTLIVRRNWGYNGGGMDGWEVEEGWFEEGKRSSKGRICTPLHYYWRRGDKPLTFQAVWISLWALFFLGSQKWDRIVTGGWIQ